MDLHNFLISPYKKPDWQIRPSGLGIFSQFMAVLGAQLIRTIRAFKRLVGMIPEAFRMHVNS